MNKLVKKRIPQFFKYINKVYGFTDVVEAVDDFRQDPDIPPAPVFLSVFWMFQLRLPSFNALEPELADHNEEVDSLWEGSYCQCRYARL